MKRKKIFISICLAILASVLIAIAFWHLVGIYESYRQDMLTYESRHLDSIVSTSGRSMQWMMESYKSQAASLMDRREFEIAEDDYLLNADAGVMDELMARPDVLEIDMTYCLAVYDANWGYISATEVGFPVKSAEETDERLDENTGIRQSADGIFWFVFQQDSDRGFHYELAVPVQTMFNYYAAAASVGRSGYLFLVDGDCRSFSYSGDGTIATQSVASLVAGGNGADQADIEQIVLSSNVQRYGYDVYKFPWPEENGASRSEIQTLVVTYPLNMEYGKLVVGAAVSFTEFNSILQGTLHNVTSVIILVLCGVLILLLLAAWIMVMNRRNALELEVVTEKANMMEEINRQQQSLEHTERLQQLGVMTTGIAHEFNNLLTPIMGQSMLLLEELADQEDSIQFENALDIYEASEKARNVLKEMSFMGKTDVDMRFRTLSLNELLKKTVNLSSLGKDPHIQQELELPKQPVYVSGNEQLLSQAFLNLCLNGCQAMGSEGTLTVVLSEEKRNGYSYARVEVFDTGGGISEKSMGSLFEPFFTTKGEHGTGLGLVICQKIIESHKGTISAANRPEGGAVFTVRLPVCAPPENIEAD